MPRAEVVHYEAQSTRQVAQGMYIQLYRSKVQFYGKFGGAGRAGRFKWLLRLAYGPRLLVAIIGAPFSRVLASRAITYRRLLAELPQM